VSGAATRLRLATRSSLQARTQAEVVARAIEQTSPGCTTELIFVDTMGDRRQDVALHQLGGQGVFVKEVQLAVLEGRADLAVHSAKDLPSTPTAGLVIGAYGDRRDPRDALIGRSLDDLAAGATVATGSVRRRAQLTELRPDLHLVELRGNIQTRLGKIPADGAIVMAAAALEVLGLTEQIAEAFDPEVFVPQVGQGAVAVECREDDRRAADALAAIDHVPTRRAVELERAFLAEIGSGCTLPVGAHVSGTRLLTYLARAGGAAHRGRVELGGGDTFAVARAAAHDALG
jgi:hydroxymethylbilane synthase